MAPSVCFILSGPSPYQGFTQRMSFPKIDVVHGLCGWNAHLRSANPVENRSFYKGTEISISIANTSTATTHCPLSYLLSYRLFFRVTLRHPPKRFPEYGEC